MNRLLLLLPLAMLLVATASLVSAAAKPIANLEPKRPTSAAAAAASRKPFFGSGAPEITIVVGYPAAPMQGHQLFIRGSAPLSWTSGIQLTQTASTQWGITLPTAGAGIWGNMTNATFFELDFKIVIDDNDNNWELGRNHRFVVQRDGPQSQSMRVCPYFFTTESQVTTYNGLYSPQLNNSRSVWQYVPAQIVENTVCAGEDVKVLVMGDGQNLADLWGMQQHLDESILGTKQTGPILVLGPYNMDSMRIYEYTFCACAPYTTYATGDLLLDFYEQTLLPFFAKKFPTVNFSPRNVGLGGSSLGGLIAAYAGVTRPQSWSTIIAMSSSFWWCYKNADAPEAFLHQILPKMTAASTKQTWYLDTGDSGPGDDDQHETSRVITTMILMHGGRVRNGNQFEIGQNVFWNLERGGFHNEQYWSNRMPRVLGFTYGRDGYNNDW